MAKKNYATISSLNSICSFRKDFSYCMNSKCLGCKFCHKELALPPRQKYRSFGLLDIELLYNKSSIEVPLTISKYCEPFATKGSIRNSLGMMTSILEKGGQVILRTSLSDIPSRVFWLMKEYPKDIMLQLRVLTSDSNLGIETRKDLAPKLPLFEDMLNLGKKVSALGVDVALFVDPLIIGVNDSDLIHFIKALSGTSINKIIVKQLFSTQKFKDYLSSIVPRYASYLSEPVGEYFTYETFTLIKELYSALELAEECNIKLSICSNKEFSSLLGYENNCCLFDNANAVYKCGTNIKCPEVLALKGIEE